MISSVIDGKVLDWKWVRRPAMGDTVFYIGDRIVGQLWKNRRGWTAVHCQPMPTNGPVNGFISRIKASEFLRQLETPSCKL